MDSQSKTKYFTMICANKNKTDSNSIILEYNKAFNPIREIDDISKFNLFLNSIIISNVEIPYRNFFNDINYDLSNFNTNKTNLSVSFYDSSGYNFDLTSNTNPLINGIDEDPSNPGYYRGVSCFIQYYSENSNLPNPGDVNFTSSYSYPRSYFNIHSLQHFLDMVNIACTSCLSKHTSLNSSLMYFYYDPSTLSYVLNMDNSIKTSSVDFYMNSFLQHMLDGFRTNYMNPTHITTEIPYRGLSYKFNKSNIPINEITTPSNYWIYRAEYGTINNLSDVLSIIIYTNGSLANARTQIFADINDNSTTLQEQRILKVLDFVFDNGSGNNNSVIQFENIVMDKPINMMSIDQFNNIKLSFKLLNTSGEQYDMYLNPQGVAMVKFTLKNKE